MLLRIARTLARSGLEKIAAKVRSGRRASRAGRPTLDRDRARSERRRPHPDERRGDEILYPTDGFTEDMQPRR